MKKNCDNCRFLDYYEADYESSDLSGFFCKKRETKDGSEENLLKALSNKSYREKSKICFEENPIFTKAEKALLRISERIGFKEISDMNTLKIIKELKSR